MSVDGTEMTVADDSQWHALATLDEIGPGQMLAREVGEVHLALYNVDGEVFVTDNVCTHAYALLTDGWLDGNVIECPLHGGQFNVCTGAAMSEPVEVNLRTYPVRLVEGRVEVQLPG
jgi:nitrite reductase/ring-hydroxylating ferredoxin subunit